MKLKRIAPKLLTSSLFKSCVTSGLSMVLTISANDPHRQKESRLSDVTDFRIWLYNQKTTAVQQYLPKSDAALQKIIRYCLTEMSDMPFTLAMGRIGQNYDKEKSKSETINIR